MNDMENKDMGGSLENNIPAEKTDAEKPAENKTPGEQAYQYQPPVNRQTPPYGGSGTDPASPYAPACGSMEFSGVRHAGSKAGKQEKRKRTQSFRGDHRRIARSYLVELCRVWHLQPGGTAAKRGGPAGVVPEQRRSARERECPRA